MRLRAAALRRRRLRGPDTVLPCSRTNLVSRTLGFPMFEQSQPEVIVCFPRVRFSSWSQINLRPGCHGVFSETRHQSFGPNGDYIPPFWIPGPNGKRFETRVHTWDNHNKTVLLPDSALL